MTERRYLDQLEPYLEDAYRHAMVAPNDEPSIRMRAYFRRVLSMKHVAGREYAFISATQWNRRSFVVVFHAALEHLLATKITVNDFYQLLLLLCPDFPRQALDSVVQLLPRNVQDCAVLATAFEIYWFHADFFRDLEPVFRAGATRADIASAVDSSLVPWDLVDMALRDAAVDITEGLSFRKFCQAVLQSEAIAQHTRSFTRRPRLSNDALARILSGRPPLDDDEEDDSESDEPSLQPTKIKKKKKGK